MSALLYLVAVWRQVLNLEAGAEHQRQQIAMVGAAALAAHALAAHRAPQVKEDPRIMGAGEPYSSSNRTGSGVSGGNQSSSLLWLPPALLAVPARLAPSPPSPPPGP